MMMVIIKTLTRCKKIKQNETKYLTILDFTAINCRPLRQKLFREHKKKTIEKINRYYQQMYLNVLISEQKKNSRTVLKKKKTVAILFKNFQPNCTEKR